MRKLFGKLLADEMRKNPNIYLLAGDVGYGVLDMSLPNCYNMGASEQAMIGAAVGLSYEGKIPICYTITPFLLRRPYEWIKHYLIDEGANVKLVGSGRDRDYGHLGSTHWCEEDDILIPTFGKVKCYWPSDTIEPWLWGNFLAPGPAYLNLRR